MANMPHHSADREPMFHEFDSSVRRILGVDMRLVYGIVTPATFVVGLIVLLAFNRTTWLLVASIALEVGALALVFTGLLGLISDDGKDSTS